MNLPCPFEATTVPITRAPRGKTTPPPADLTGSASTPVNLSPTLFWLAASRSVIVTVTEAPARAVTCTGGGGTGGAGAGAAAVAGAAGATAGAAFDAGGAAGATAGAAAGVAEFVGAAAGGAAAGSELALLGAGVAAGAGAGVELLHPLKIRDAERAKLVAKTRNLSRMGSLRFNASIERKSTRIE